ncbi:MAG TPA: RHS repeat-associated core domain-containing protein, partial [Arenimonas sp.]|uniref:RHS repeat-associated core domain-containing protein n=1 Tax=Arenimonas sp. TaxID=1872635 RepID=UPI002D802663
HGRRTAQWRADGTVRVSLYTLDGRLQGEADNRAVGSTDYIYLGGTLVAKRFQHWSGIPPLVTYLHSDGLGSPVLETDATGAVLSRERFLSYGGAVDGAVKDAVGYTGHQEDPASGLVYMQQRYYDPAAGVFTSVDPVAAFGNPIGQFHRYRYANNNPYRFVDPDGQACTTADMRVSCVPNMRKGHDLPSFSFEKPDGWPKEIGLSWIKSHEYRYEDSTQGKSDASVQLVIVRDPSPGRDRPATLRGTPNDASPASGWRGPIAKGAGGSPIKSYSFYDENGNTWVVNVTMPGHPLFPGYVLRGAVDGKIITYGEGDGWLQALGPFSQIGINDEFKRANADAVKNAE